MNTDTPLTDGYEGDCPLGFRPVSFCRELERERNRLEEDRLCLLEELALLRAESSRFRAGLPMREPRKMASIAELFGELFAS